MSRNEKIVRFFSFIMALVYTFLTIFSIYGVYLLILEFLDKLDYSMLIYILICLAMPLLFLYYAIGYYKKSFTYKDNKKY